MDTRIDGSILSGKIVLLTGAGGGIGLEAAKAFAEMGAKVLIAEIDREKGKKAAEDITVKFPGAAFFLHTDLSDGTAIRKLCGDILARFGCPDIIFNNAAAVITGKIGEVSIEDWDLCYAVLPRQSFPAHSPWNLKGLMSIPIQSRPALLRRKLRPKA